MNRRRVASDQLSARVDASTRSVRATHGVYERARAAAALRVAA